VIGEAARCGGTGCRAGGQLGPGQNLGQPGKGKPGKGKQNSTHVSKEQRTKSRRGNHPGDLICMLGSLKDKS